MEVANPMSDAPPLKMRPTWNVLTIVEPEAAALTSTSVACWLDGLVKVSVLSWVRAIAGGGGVCSGGCELGLEPQAVMTHQKAEQGSSF